MPSPLLDVLTQARGRSPWAADYYLLSDARSTNYTDALIQDGRDAMTGVWQDAVYMPRPIDYGLAYASKFFRRNEDPEDRLLWVGWIYEVRTMSVILHSSKPQHAA